MLLVYQLDVGAAEAAAQNLVKNNVAHNQNLVAHNQNLVHHHHAQSKSAQNLAHNLANQSVDADLAALRLAALSLAAKDALSSVTKG